MTQNLSYMYYTMYKQTILILQAGHKKVLSSHVGELMYVFLLDN